MLGGDADAGSTGPARLGADGEDGREAEGPVDVDAELEALEVRDVRAARARGEGEEGHHGPAPAPAAAGGEEAHAG